MESEGFLGARGHSHQDRNFGQGQSGTRRSQGHLGGGMSKQVIRYILPNAMSCGKDGLARERGLCSLA
jgi:hypothetical protein